jgi:hypothetical protein
MLGYLYGKKVWLQNSLILLAQAIFRTYLPMKMEQTECSETSAYKFQTPGNYPEESIQNFHLLYSAVFMPCKWTWQYNRVEHKPHVMHTEQVNVAVTFCNFMKWGTWFGSRRRRRIFWLTFFVVFVRAFGERLELISSSFLSNPFQVIFMIGFKTLRHWQHRQMNHKSANISHNIHYIFTCTKQVKMSLSTQRLWWSRGSVLAGTQVRGFVPGRSRRIFRAKKSSARFPSEGK